MKKTWNGISGRETAINKSWMCETTWCLWVTTMSLEIVEVKKGSQRMKEIIKID